MAVNNPHEVPALAIPREDIFKVAISLRLMSDSLSRIRQRHGRAAFDDAENAARKDDAARLNKLRWFTEPDAADWRRARETGSIYTDTHPETGMTVRVAPLRDGRFGVQAGWPDNHVDLVTESSAAAQHVHRWLWDDPTTERVGGLRGWLGSRHDEAMKSAEIDQAKAWAGEHAAEWFGTWRAAHTMADPAGQRRAEDLLVSRMHSHHEADKQADRSEGGAALVAGADRDWADFVSELAHDAEDAQASWIGPYPSEMSLTDRLRGRVPDKVLDNPNWPGAEKQFRELVDGGTDPAMLTAAVARLDWDSARAPSGYASWAMRESDEQARTERRELAAEWLIQASSEDPRDVSDAAELFGKLGDDFDAQLTTKFPALLDSTAAMLDDRAATEQSQASTTDTLAAGEQFDDEHNATAQTTADLAQSALAWHGGDVDETPIRELWPPLVDDENAVATARADAGDARTHAAQDQDQAAAVRAPAVPLPAPPGGGRKPGPAPTAAEPARPRDLNRGRGQHR